MITIDQYFRDYEEVNAHYGVWKPFTIKEFAQSYAAYLLKNGHVSNVVDWIPIEHNPNEFTRLCKAKNCLILYDNGEEVPHHEKAPFAISVGFKPIKN